MTVRIKALLFMRLCVYTHTDFRENDNFKMS